MQKLILFSIALWLQLSSAQNQGSSQHSDPGFKGLINSRTMTIKADGTSTLVAEDKVEITTNEGATDWSNYFIENLKTNDNFRLLEAEVNTEGQSYKTSSKKLVETTQPSTTDNGLSENRKIAIPLKHVKVGSVVLIKYEIESKPLVPGVFFYSAGISNKQLALNESQTFISEGPLAFISTKLEPYFLITKNVRDKKTTIKLYPDSLANSTAAKRNATAVLTVTTAKSWRQLNEFVSAKYQAAVQKPLPESFAKVARDIATLGSSKAKIEMAADRLQKLITYSGDWRSEEGQFFPAGHVQVLKSGKGDCKDYATALAAILRQAGFQTNVALSFRTKDFLESEFILQMAKLPSLSYFDHAIVWAKDVEGKTWWIDPTNPKVLADVLSEDILGNFALILDRTSDEVKMLPIRNKMDAETELNQTISIQADNSVDLAAKLTVNTVGYNTLAMAERRFGNKNMKSILMQFINPFSKGTVDFSVEDSGSKVGYLLKSSASDWVHDKVGKYSSIYINHIGTNMLMGLQYSKVPSFGSEGIRRATTLIKGKSAVDPIDHDCYGRSKWFDFERTVSNGPQGILINDILNVKIRSVSLEDFKSSSLQTALSDLDSCSRNSEIVTFLNPSQLTAQDLLFEKLKGPPVEKMTDADAEKLRSITDLNFRSYKLAKLFRYYSAKISMNDINAFYKRARVIRGMGYISEDDYSSSYLNSALDDVMMGLKLTGSKFHTKLMATKIEINVDLKKFAEANQDYKVLLQNDPKSFDTYYSGYYINSALKKYTNAEVFLNHAIRVAKLPEDIVDGRIRMAFLLSSQKKYKEAFDQHDLLVKTDPTNAWHWHNGAAQLLSLGEFDKCIEWERKALSLGNFGVARDTLSTALAYKAHRIFAGKLNDRKAMEAAIPFFLEALKWNPENRKALQNYALISVSMKEAYNDSSHLEKSNKYLTEALAKKPNDKDLQGLTHFIALNLERKPSGSK